MKKPLAALATLALLATGAACGGTEAKDTSARTLTVYAAASLTSTFTEAAKKFEAEHDGVTVKLNFGGSSDLVAQIQQGAPADVFASADTKNMDKATADKLVEGDPVIFASNTLEIAVPPDNPAHIMNLKDLTKPGTKLVVCAPEVPCGSAADKVEAAAKLTFKPVSEEQSVTDVLAKVTTGEADAGLVYVTDVAAAGDKVRGIEFPESRDAVNQYPIAVLADSKQQKLAGDFMELITKGEGQVILSDAGFLAP